MTERCPHILKMHLREKQYIRKVQHQIVNSSKENQLGAPEMCHGYIIARYFQERRSNPQRLMGWNN